MATIITIRTETGLVKEPVREVTLTVGRNYGHRRVDGARAISIDSVLGSGMSVDADLNPDGSITVTRVWAGSHESGNNYVHLNSMYGPHGYVHQETKWGSPYSPIPTPTEAQRARIAAAWFGRERIFGSSCGAPLLRWAFGEMSMQERFARYNDGQSMAFA